MGISTERWLILPDIHVPFHDHGAVDCVLQVLENTEFTGVHQLGDFADLSCVSKFNGYSAARLQSLPTLLEEYDAARNVWAAIIDAGRRRNSDCVFEWSEGNHEYRIRRFSENMPQCADLLSIEHNFADLFERDIKWIDNWRGEHGGIPRKFGSNLLVLHGRRHSKYHARWMADDYTPYTVLYGHCFDETTEILTKRGWVKGFDLIPSDEVMTMCLETQRLEYQTPTAFHRHSREVHPRLIEIKNQNVDLLITPQHGLVDFKPKRENRRLITAEDFLEKSVCEFACAGVEERLDLPLTDDELRLLVWIVTDGSFENSSLVRWHLKKPRKLKRLEEILAANELTFTKNESYDGRFKYNVSLKNHHAREWFSWPKKELPRWLLQASTRQTKIIFEEYIQTDGCKTGPRSIQISTSKQPEAEILQTLAVTSGFRCNMVIRERDPVHPSQKRSYVLSINERSTVLINRDKGQWVENPGTDVWCLTVPNGTLLVRRNGKVVLTQNCHDLSAFSKQNFIAPGDRQISMAQSIGYLADPRQEYVGHYPTNWQQGFATVSVLPNGQTFHSVYPISGGRCVFDGVLYESRVDNKGRKGVAKRRSALLKRLEKEQRNSNDRFKTWNDWGW